MDNGEKNSSMEFIRELLFHPMKWTVYLIGLAVLPPIQAEEEDTGVFQIDSATDELSADIHLAREEGKEVPKSEAETESGPGWALENLSIFF